MSAVQIFKNLTRLVWKRLKNPRSMICPHTVVIHKTYPSCGVRMSDCIACGLKWFRVVDWDAHEAAVQKKKGQP